MKKSRIIIITFVITFVLTLGITVFADEIYQLIKVDYPIIVDGTAIVTTQPALNYNGYTYLPLKDIATAAGSLVSWDDTNKQVVITNKSKDGIQTLKLYGTIADTYNTAHRLMDDMFDTYVVLGLSKVQQTTDTRMKVLEKVRTQIKTCDRSIQSFIAKSDRTVEAAQAHSIDLRSNIDALVESMSSARDYLVASTDDLAEYYSTSNTDAYDLYEENISGYIDASDSAYSKINIGYSANMQAIINYK